MHDICRNVEKNDLGSLRYSGFVEMYIVFSVILLCKINKYIKVFYHALSYIIMYYMMLYKFRKVVIYI